KERKQKVNFSEPDYHGGLVAVVMKNDGNSSGMSPQSWFSACIASLSDSFDRTFMRENRWKLVLEGLKITVLITVLAAIFGTLLAFPVCFLRRAQHAFPRILGKLFISLMQGTPILVILMILYYVIFAKVNLNAVIVAVIGFGVNFAAYVGEMLRTGIDSVPRGQREAALALGFSNTMTFFKVILPQALRQILPIYRGEFINMLKTTSIVGYIAIQDLTKMSDIIRSRTYEAFFPLIATAAIYFITAWILTSFLTGLERRLDPLSRRKYAGNGGR
ncbi:MAG: ABC transporter substrate-binding protein/permease, partial [Victivallaceae bacterium]